MDSNHSSINVYFLFEKSYQNALLSSLSELVENLCVIFEHTGINHDLQEILNDAVPQSMSYIVESIISNEMKHVVARHVNDAGIINQQIWAIVSHSISKTIRDSPQMYNISQHIENFLMKSLRTATFSEKLSCSMESLTQPRQIKQLSKDIQTHRPLSIRKQELNMLLHTNLPQTTMIMHESWPQIRQYLCNILCGENQDIFILSLKFHAKFVSSTTFTVMKEGLMNLMKGFCLYYSQNLSQTSGQESIITTTDKRLFEMGQLILCSIKKLSSHVAKANDGLEEILTYFIELLSMKPKDKKIIKPYAVISILDPNTLWFTCLVHGLITRNITLSIMSKSNLIEDIIINIISRKTYANKIDLTCMSHSINIFIKLIQFKGGQSFFPLTLTTESEPITLEYVYVQVVKYLNTNGTEKLREEMIKKCIAVPILQLGILQSDSPLMRSLMEPLPTNVPKHLANILEVVVENPAGVNCVLGSHDAGTLMDYTGMSLQDEVKCPEEIKCSLLHICGKLFENHLGFVKFEGSPLIKKVIYQYEKFSSQNEATLHTSLTRFLLSICSTPLGLLWLTKYPDILEQLLDRCKATDLDVSNRCLALAAILKHIQPFENVSLQADANSSCVKTTAIIQSQTELHKFLSTSQDSLHDNNWTIQLQETYKSPAHKNITPQTICDLVNQLSTGYSKTPQVQPRQKSTLFDKQRPEIHWIIQYGEENHLMEINSPTNENNLLEVYGLFHSKMDDCFDWFLGISFLVCAGDVDKCCSFVTKVSSLPVSTLLWPAKCKYKSKRDMFKLGHKLELVIEAELPMAARILKMGGVCWWTICQQWLARHFLNILSWEQICHWLTFTLSNQTEESCIYFCASLLKYLESSIAMAYSDRNLSDFLKEPIIEYNISNNISFIHKLTTNYSKLKL